MEKAPRRKDRSQFEMRKRRGETAQEYADRIADVVAREERSGEAREIPPRFRSRAQVIDPDFDD